MKSQFEGIVKVKKQLLDTAQMNLLQARQKAQNLETNILQIVSDIATIQTPTSGNFSLIAQVNEKKRILNVHKNQLTKELEGVKKLINHLENVYKHANKEFEKMNYLKTKEEEEFYKQAQKKEQLRLDEISIQLFARGMARDTK